MGDHCFDRLAFNLWRGSEGVLLYLTNIAMLGAAAGLYVVSERTEGVAAEILSGLTSGREGIYVGKARAFRLLHRWAPRWAKRLLRDG
jgi:hypothetical protein